MRMVDSLGRLLTEITTDAWGTMEKAYGYDANDNITSFALTAGGTQEQSVIYQYDKQDRLWKVFEGGQTTTPTAVYAYDDNGNRLSLEYDNGNSTLYQYNLANRVKEITNKRDTTTLSQYRYNYYLDGNWSDELETVEGKLTEYTYDGLGRLVTETEKEGGATISSISYTYDDYNNRSSMEIAGGAVTTYAYDKNNRLITETKVAGDITEITRYGYDYNGNMIYKGTETLEPSGGGTESIAVYISGIDEDSASVTLNEYDGLNQLIKTTVGDKTINYAYDANGLRISKTVNGDVTRYAWQGSHIVIELDEGNEVTAKYVRGINLIASSDGDGSNKRYYLFNGHGDVVQLTGSDGNVSKEYDYDAFGNEKNPDDADTNPFRYCGEYFDKETGTYYLRARYYHPVIGRFISVDSVWGSDRDPLSLNLYSYCHNDPINFKDPSGNEEERDVIILSPSDYAIIKALTQAYYYYQSKKDYDAMDAIRRLSTSIRQKPEYKDKYEDGICRDNYKYSSNRITSIANVYIDDYEYLNKLEKMTSILGFIGGFLQTPYGPIISAAAMASKREVTLLDILVESIGNIPYGVGRTIGTISFIIGMLGPEPYKPNDFEVQVQIISERGRRYDIFYYMVKADGSIRLESTYKGIHIPNRGRIDWQYD